jgi:hypothetical protein
MNALYVGSEGQGDVIEGPYLANTLLTLLDYFSCHDRIKLAPSARLKTQFSFSPSNDLLRQEW